jgi:PAS domain S-box-containing protein
MSPKPASTIKPDTDKTRAQLLSELQELRAQVAILREAGVKSKNIAEALPENEECLRLAQRAAHQSLVKKSGYLESFFNHTITPLVLLDRDFNFIRVNEAYARACQKGVDDFPGHNHFEFYPSDAKAIFEDVIHTRQPIQVVARPFVFPDHPEWGVTYWNWSLTPLLDDRGEVKALFFALEDVTESKRMEEELRRSRDELEQRVLERTRELSKSEAHLAKAQEISHVGSWEYDLKTGLQRWSDESCRIFGFSLERVNPDMNLFLSIVHPDDRGRLLEVMKDVCEAGGSFKADYRIIGPDGYVRYVHCEGEVLRDESGRAIKMFGVNQDITERKRAEEALRESEASLAKAQRITHLGNWEWDVKEDKVFCSDEFYRVFGLERRDDITYGRFIDTLCTGDRDRVNRAVEAALYEGEPYNIDYCVIWPDGSEHNIHAEGEVTYGPGREPVKMFGTVQDITKRKRVEEELKVAKQQAELYLDLMGHDINNMHQVALGYLELARDIPLGEGQAMILDKPVEVLQRSAKLISNVRKLQRLREGTFQDQDVDVCEVLSDVQREYGAMPNKTITLNLNGFDRCHVRANELLHDVFSNLVGNAVKHTGGRAVIVVNLNIVEDDGGRYCRVAVEDDGPGIPNDFKGIIFNRALKSDSKSKGIGLGLYLVKSLVDSYGGRVWAEDRVKGDHTKGARFMVMLPATEK